MRRLATLAVLVALGVMGATPALAVEADARPDAVDLDALFIGAHPDDEASILSTLGQWNEYADVQSGVITITRGEGGGNAVGPEEGPALGLLREAEERRAVGRAGIRHVYNLDKVDFYYTVSSPLTEQIWGRQSSLEKIVRIIRATRPEIVITMNPSPSPGNHGNHQYAARLAIEAFYAAADPDVFPEQIEEEGLSTWRVNRLFRTGATGAGATVPNPTGPNCAADFTPTDPTDVVFGVWAGRASERNGGRSWAQVEREAQREYVSQGWGGFSDAPTDPALIGCDRFTQIASRVPFTAGSTSPTAMLEGALVRAAGRLPLGTEFYLTTDRFDVSPGGAFTVTAHARSAAGARLRGATVSLALPAGWTATGSGRLGNVRRVEKTTTFRVTPSASATTGARARISATLRANRGASGTTTTVVRVAPAVQGTLQRLPQVAQFEAWTREVGVRQLGGLVKPVLTLGSGETRTIRVDVRNTSTATESGTVSLTLPAGFTADAASKPYSGLAAGATTAVTFEVTNTDPALPTANQGGVNGDYDFDIVTTSSRGSSTERAGLELVPVTAIPQAATAPTLDGVESPGEYTGPTLDLSRRWEGQNCTSPADCSAWAKVTWSDDALYFLIRVTDDTLGTVLAASDCKRHWRTDSVEIALDPRGTSENTSTTFKTGIFPTTLEGGPCWQRDADNRQGPGAQTAPGMQVVSRLDQPYTGYTLEVKIALADLPAAVDPARLGLNMFVYDSDTQDLTGQTRIGWSTFGGVQGDPYRWGHATLPGYTPPAGRPTTPAEPVIPLTAARSVDSPQSIQQASEDGVGLGGDPAAPETSARIVAGPTLSDTTLAVTLRTREAGTAHVFAWAGNRTVASTVVELGAVRNGRVFLGLSPAQREALAGGGQLLVAYETESGTVSLSEAIRP